MGKYVNDLAMDAAFDFMRAQMTRLCVCSSEPTTYAEATSTYMLAHATALTSTELSLDDGDASGRKMSMASQTNLTVDTTGTAAHVALVGTTDSVLLLGTTCTTQALTTGNTVSVPGYDDEIGDAS